MTERPRFELVTTTRGAPALRDNLAGEVMHPTVGPREEAERLYVGQTQLAARLAGAAPGSPLGKPLVVYDVGLGAGSNAAAAWRASEARAGADGGAGAGEDASAEDGASAGGDARAKLRRLHLYSFERDLGAMEAALAHAAAFGLDGAVGVAARAILEVGVHETPRTRWRLVRGELPETLAEAPEPADLLFWDPYSVRADPTLWTVAAFARARARAASRALLVTYSNATRVRAALLLAGFAVGVGEAIGPKAETTIAAVHAADLARPLDRRFLARLGRSSAPLPPDAPADALARLAALPQLAAG